MEDSSLRHAVLQDDSKVEMNGQSIRRCISSDNESSDEETVDNDELFQKRIDMIVNYRLLSSTKNKVVTNNCSYFIKN